MKKKFVCRINAVIKTLNERFPRDKVGEPSRPLALREKDKKLVAQMEALGRHLYGDGFIGIGEVECRILYEDGPMRIASANIRHQVEVLK